MRKWYKNTYFTYTYSFLGVMLIVFLPFFLKDRTLINNADVYNQVYPFFVYISDYIREFFSSVFSGQNISFFDFSIGYGQNIFGAFSFYGIGDITYYLCALIPRDYSAYAFSLSILIKIYFSGIAFIYMAKNIGIANIGLLISALFYSTSGYILFYGLVFPSNIYSMILLPFILTGIDEIATNRRRISPILVVTLFLQAVSGFYYLYMNAIVAILFFIVTSLCMQEMNLKEFIKRGIRCLWQAILGVGLGAFMLLPALMSYIESNRSSRNFGSVVNLLIPETADFVNRIKKLFLPCGYEPGLSLPVVLVIILFVFYRIKEGNIKRWKILVTVFGIAYFIPITGCLFNGGAYSVDRYTYIIYFVFAIATGFAIDNISRYRKAIVISFLINVILLGLFQNGPTVLGGKGWQAFFKSYSEMDMIDNYSYSQAVKEKSYEDEFFERVDIKDESPINASLIWGNNSVNSYYSINVGSIAEFYKQYGISSGIRSDFLYEGLDGRPGLESIMSVRKYQNNAGEVVDNEYALPMGVLYTNIISETDANKLSSIEKNAISTKALIIDGLNTNYDISNINADLVDDIMSPAEPDREYYLLIPDVHYYGSDDYVDIYYGNKNGRIHREGYIYDNVSNDILFLLPEDWQDTVEDPGVSFTDDKDIQYGKPVVYSVDISDRETEINELKKHSLTDFRISGDSIVGSISSEKDGVLFISVPYSKGWKCYVDDVETNIVRADYAFCGIYLDKGNHSIRMEYTTPGLKMGIIVSLICVIIVICTIVCTKNKGRRND